MKKSSIAVMTVIACGVAAAMVASVALSAQRVAKTDGPNLFDPSFNGVWGRDTVNRSGKVDQLNLVQVAGGWEAQEDSRLTAIRANVTVAFKKLPVVDDGGDLDQDYVTVPALGYVDPALFSEQPIAWMDISGVLAGQQDPSVPAHHVLSVTVDMPSVDKTGVVATN